MKFFMKKVDENRCLRYLIGDIGYDNVTEQ